MNVYPLMCTLMNIKCNPNNGSLEIFEPFIELNNTNNQNRDNKIYLIFAFLVAKFKNLFI